MQINIRKCMVSDATKIFDLCKSELGYDFSREQVEANVRRLIGSAQNLLLVAESDGEAIGFIHANNHDPVYAPPMKDIIAVAIDPKFRQMGIGRQLIEAVEKWARDTGAQGVRVNAGVEQKNAGLFYKSLGYQYIKSIYNFRKMF